MNEKLPILVTRAVFPEVIDRLSRHFVVESNQHDEMWTPEELASRLQDKAGAFMTGIERVDGQLLSACPRLRICANMTVGFNNFDLESMSAAGVLGTNAPEVLTQTTADFGFALLLATARRVTESERFLRAGLWTRWRFDLFAGVDVHGSTLGIIGMGRIGQAIAQRAAFGFGMDVIYHNRHRLDAQLEASCRARHVSKEELLKVADHVMIVVPYSASSHHLVGADELALMKPTATLINIARGGVVDDAALELVLRERRIAAAGLDVFEGEPVIRPGFLELSNVVLTPHIASSTAATRMAMAMVAVENLVEYLVRSRAVNPLNPDILKG
jgi:gluconate 2-dehydrogenase